MSTIQFQEDVARTIAPITDSTYERIIPLDVSITLRHLLDLMRDADLQKRRVFYGQAIRTEDCVEWESLVQVSNRLSSLPDPVASSGKGVFAKPIPSIALNPQSGMGTETRSRLDNLLNRYHSVLGMLSEIAELAIIDTMILQELLTQLYADPTLNDFDDIVEDVTTSVQHTLNANAKKAGTTPISIKSSNARQFEELADGLFYFAHHLLTNEDPNYSGVVSLSSLCQAVVAKLKERFPDAFSTARSENHVRNREAEMSAFYAALNRSIEANKRHLKNEEAFSSTKDGSKLTFSDAPSPSTPIAVEDEEGRNIEDVLSLPRPAVDPNI